MATLVQYVVIRSDLMTALKWPLGAVIAQACHACSAVMSLFYDDPNMKDYISELDRMHKVVLQADDEASLKLLSESLISSKVDHKLWTEQPENTATCLVTKPYRKDEIQHHFKKFKLFK